MSARRIVPAPLLGALLLGFLLTGERPAAIASTESAAAEFRLLASGGALFFWDGASTELSPAPAGIASGSQGFRSVLPLGAGRVLLVEPSEPSAGKEKEKKLREGEAVILGLRGPAAQRGQVVGFEGAPRAAAVSPDGRRAWVLAWRGSPGTQGSRGWLHAIDVERGELVDSSLLPSIASGIATDAAGHRLYVALQDRIQTYGAEPMRVSWQYRSPGANGPIAVAPGRDLLAVGRGAQLALFDAARLAALDAQERHTRKDDATTVATLPFSVTRLAWAQDGTLLAAIGERGLVFLDPGNGALLWPQGSSLDFSRSTDAQVLEFPGPDHDLVVALTPEGTVSALRAPIPSLPPPPVPAAAVQAVRVEDAVAVPLVATSPPPAAAGTAEKPVPASAPAAAKASPPAHEAGASRETSPATETGPATETSPATGTGSAVKTGASTEVAAAPAPAQPSEPPAQSEPARTQEEEVGPPLLRGRVTGKAAGAKTIVLYGPNNILKEATRVTILPDGTWSLPLPAPGTYRIVAIGDGSTPIPVVPTFRTVTVRAGIAESGIDFEIR